MKGKAFKLLIATLVASALVYIGVPEPVATQVGDVLGEQAAEMVD